MANCANCNTDIVFGGVKAEGLRFCRPACHDTFMQFRNYLQQAEKYYRYHLEQLRRDPTNPEIKTKTLEAGRTYASATRKGKNVAVFDEVALSNDIQAACAAAQPALAATPVLTIEQRLQRLENLRAKALISDDEYREKRTAILAEL